MVLRRLASGISSGSRISWLGGAGVWIRLAWMVRSHHPGSGAPHRAYNTSAKGKAKARLRKEKERQSLSLCARLALTAGFTATELRAFFFFALCQLAYTLTVLDGRPLMLHGRGVPFAFAAAFTEWRAASHEPPYFIVLGGEDRFTMMSLHGLPVEAQVCGILLFWVFRVSDLFEELIRPHLPMMGGVNAGSLLSNLHLGLIERKRKGRKLEGQPRGVPKEFDSQISFLMYKANHVVAFLPELLRLLSHAFFPWRLLPGALSPAQLAKALHDVIVRVDWLGLYYSRLVLASISTVCIPDFRLVDAFLPIGSGGIDGLVLLRGGKTVSQAAGQSLMVPLRQALLEYARTDATFVTLKQEVVAVFKETFRDNRPMLHHAERVEDLSDTQCLVCCFYGFRQNAGSDVCH